MRASVAHPVLLVLLLLWVSLEAAAAGGDFNITTSSYLGGPANAERVVGIAIQSDGDIVVAVNASAGTAALESALLLNNATAASGGAVLLLDALGTQVKAAARVASAVFDLALDAQDRIYVAAGRQGGISLEADLSGVRWTQPGVTNAWTHRVDVGAQGTVAFLVSAANVAVGDLDEKAGAGQVQLRNADTGAPVGGGGAFSAVASNAQDVVVHDDSDTVIVVGWRQAASDYKVAGIFGLSFTGETKWTGYNWAKSQVGSSVSDNVFSRAALGEDGKLYAAGNSDGGNHIFRFSPTDVTRAVTVSNYDKFTDYSSAGAANLGFIGRYAVTGSSITYEAGQGVFARTNANTNYPNGRPNSFDFQGGGIAADSLGRVYLGGGSASNLPFSPQSQWYTGDKEGQETFNPFPAGYGGGAAFQALYYNSSTARYTRRLYCNRLAFGRVLAVTVRTIDNVPHIAYGGFTDGSGAYVTSNAIQTSSASAADGFFAVHIRGANSEPGPSPGGGGGGGGGGAASAPVSWLRALLSIIEASSS